MSVAITTTITIAARITITYTQTITIVVPTLLIVTCKRIASVVVIVISSLEPPCTAKSWTPKLFHLIHGGLPGSLLSVDFVCA